MDDEGQGRRDPRSREADRALLARLWPVWVALAAVILYAWSNT